MVILASAMAPAASAQASGEATLDRAITAYKSVKTLRADFNQHLTNPLVGSTATSTGSLVQRRPRHMALKFSDPAGDMIVADGKHLWVYLPSSAPGQVIRMPIGQNAEGVPDLSAAFLDAPRDRYEVSAAAAGTVGKRAAHVITLSAKDKSLPFTTAKVWVDDADGLVRQFELTETSGLERRITLSNVVVNPAVKDSDFAFTVPDGVRVVDR
jgi:outer membrane lipoprotein carrier protein